MQWWWWSGQCTRLLLYSSIYGLTILKSKFYKYLISLTQHTTSIYPSLNTTEAHKFYSVNFLKRTSYFKKKSSISIFNRQLTDDGLRDADRLELLLRVATPESLPDRIPRQHLFFETSRAVEFWENACPVLHPDPSAPRCVKSFNKICFIWKNIWLASVK